MKIMIAYDGTIQSKEALVYGMNKARENGGEVVALQVFNNTMFVDYDASVDAEAIARTAFAQQMSDAKAIIREHGDGVRVSVFSTDGNPEDEVVGFAQARKVDLLLCPPRFKSIISRYQKTLGASAIAPDVAGLHISAVSTR